MRLFYKLFRQDPDSRESIITMTSGLGIFMNVMIASVKVIIGIIASSLAIISEGINNAADALNAILTLLGTKLAKKHPDEKHPFGYGRIEYLTGFVIAVIILVTGIELLISSVKLIFNPTELKISYLSLIIVAVSAVIKLCYGLYTIKMGKKAESSALVGVGKDSRNDCFASIITIAVAVVFLIWHFSLDAYAGIITSLIIIKTGFEVLKETVGDLLGRGGEKEFADKLYQEIRSTPYVLNAADMMLHNYGPDRYSGSVNVEIDHEKSIGEIYDILHKLQLRIMYDYNVVMVFGIYAVDNDHEEVKEIRKDVTSYVKEKEHVKSYHAIYLEPGTDKIYCDLVVDYKERDWDGLRKDFIGYMGEKYPGKEIVLTIETEYV